jgi:hypothetical protein
MTSKIKTTDKALADKANSSNKKHSPKTQAAKESPGTMSVPADGAMVAPMPDLSGLFFNVPTGRPDGVFEPLVCGVAEQLVAAGLPRDAQKEALLIYMAMNSAKLGYPLSLLLMPDDPLTAVSLINRVKNLAPANSFIEFQKMKPEQLFINGGAPFRNKCIVSSDPAGFSKVMSDFEMMLTRGHTVRQEIRNRKYDVSIEEFQAKWPISFIGLAPPVKREHEWHPSIIQMPIKSSDVIPVMSGNGLPSHPGYSLSVQKVKKTFERLKPRPVVIPFIDQVLTVLINSGTAHVDCKMDQMVKIISLCAIINNPPPVTIEELGSYVYDTDIQAVRQFLAGSGRISPGDIGNDSSSEITADRKDFYLAHLLLDGVIRADNTYMTERQLRVYDAVRTYNLGRLKLTVDPVDRDNEAESLARIAKSSGCWADVNRIFELMNNGSEPILAMATIYKDLMELLKNGILGRAKPPKTNHYGYFVMRLNMDQSMVLPEPSKLKISGMDEGALDIINPLTALSETI